MTSEIPELKVEYVPTNSIKAYERNAKKHPPEQIEEIKASIRLLADGGDLLKGFKDPIGVWHDTIVEGHGRLMAAQELGMDTVPIIRLDDLTDEQRRAYTLVHNKTTMDSGFDFGMLDRELEDLDIDLSQFGFNSIESEEDIDGLFADAEPKEQKETQAEKIQCPHCGQWFSP